VVADDRAHLEVRPRGALGDFVGAGRGAAIESPSLLREGGAPGRGGAELLVAGAGGIHRVGDHDVATLVDVGEGAGHGLGGIEHDVGGAGGDGGAGVGLVPN